MALTHTELTRHDVIFEEQGWNVNLCGNRSN
jgi:hypothetical protein